MARNSPLGEKRTWLTQPSGSEITVPVGYSRWARLEVPGRTTAIDSPSAAKSAHKTFSRTSCGAPPARWTCAIVRTCVKWANDVGCSAIAISPFDEIERIWEEGRPSERESELSKRVENISWGRPSHAAP